MANINNIPVWANTPQMTPLRQNQLAQQALNGGQVRETGGPIDRGIDPRTSASHRLQDGWRGLTEGDSYHALFGNQGHADPNDDNLRAILSQLPDGVLPDLKAKAQSGKLASGDIKELQSFLTEHNLDVGKAGRDGKYGADTHKALEKFLHGEGQETKRATGAAATGAAAGAAGVATTKAAGIRADHQEVERTERDHEVAQAGPGQQTTPGQGASPVTIGPGTKVLEIGDSHTVGTFGQELDKKLRSTGAQVATYGSAGASASNYIKGTPTTYGYSEHHADGTTSTTPYGQSHATPKLEELIEKEHPNVLVINLGANFRGAGKDGIDQQVASLGEIAKKHNIPIVWVGPPKTKQDTADGGGSIQRFDQTMHDAVAPYGTYVASSQFTPQYVGQDPAGIHYTGPQGAEVSRRWADGVFGAITGQP